MQGGPRRRLLVLGAGAGQLGVLEAARARGIHVIAVDRNPAAPGFALADRRAIVSVEDEHAIDRLAAAERVEGIIAPGLDYPTAIAARVAAHHRLGHPLEPVVAQVAASKLRQRERLREAGVPSAPYRAVASLGEAYEAALALGLPVVVKPPDRQGQRGLSVADDSASLEAAFDRAVEVARGSVVLVERLMRGREVTVTAFSTEGFFHPLTVADRVAADGPAFGVALAHVWPSELSEGETRAVFALARAAAEAIGVEDGPTYTQVIVGANGPIVGEVAARLGSGHDGELCRAAVGVDLDGLAIASALGERAVAGDLRPNPAAGGACVRFLIAEPGVVEAVEGMDEASSGDGVVWMRRYRGPGDRVSPLRDASDRAGAVLTLGGSRAQAYARANVAAGRVRFLPVDVQAAAESA